MKSAQKRYKEIYSFERKNDVFPVNFFCWNDTYKSWIKERLPISFDNALRETINYFLSPLNQMKKLEKRV